MRFCLLLLFLSLIACSEAKQITKQVVAVVPHVIDPLSGEELKTAADVLNKAGLSGNGWYIQSLSTYEPDKTADGLYPSARDVERKALAVVLNLDQKTKLECVINLNRNIIESQKNIAHGEPALLFIEQKWAKEAMVKDERVIKAMATRGFTDMNAIHVEPWATGDLSYEKNIDPTHRYLRTTFYYRNGSLNPYARPIEGVTAIYDTTTKQVLNVVDAGKLPMQPDARDFFAASQKALQPPVGFKNTHPNIKISGREVEWRGWKFRFQVHPREGLVIYDVKRRNQSSYESVLDRGSLSEMIVPYSDPDSLWYWKAAFDEGEYGVGSNVDSLMRGIHFPVDGLTFDSEYMDETGVLATIKDSVAIFENNGGIAWSHYDYDTNTQAGRGSRELVVLSFFTVGNYDYGLKWVFKEDGTVEVQVILTGVLLGKGSVTQKCERCAKIANPSNRVDSGDRFGAVIDKNVIGTAHQHHFNFRLDFAIAGGKNSVAEISLGRTEEEEDPYGNAFLLVERVLGTEKEAMTSVDHRHAKHWWIFNRSKKNSLGHFAGFLLEPGKTSDFFEGPRSPVLRRAPFLANNFYVTKFDRNEMHAAGDYPNQSGGDGIPTWINKRNAVIDNEDLVVWYTMGITHLPCAEEWPIMPIHRASFTMRPMGFHERNPLIDLDGFNL